jgi:16S rRNA G966 N2-methylase RsmD
LAGVRDKETGKYNENKIQILKQIFIPETAEEVKEALFTIMETNPDYVNVIRAV